MSDCSAEDPACSCSDFQSQDRLHQYPGRRAAGGDAVSDEEPVKGSSYSGAALCSEQGQYPSFSSSFYNQIYI